MLGLPYFNAPWFDQTAATLRKMHGVTEVFNPVDHDREHGFDPMKFPDGSAEDMATGCFDRRAALLADWSWIGKNSDGLIVGPLWRYSTGAVSEVACHQALGLPVWEAHVFMAGIRSTTVLPLLNQ